MCVIRNIDVEGVCIDIINKYIYICVYIFIFVHKQDDSKLSFRPLLQFHLVSPVEC